MRERVEKGRGAPEPTGRSRAGGEAIRSRSGVAGEVTQPRRVASYPRAARFLAFVVLVGIVTGSAAPGTAFAPGICDRVDRDALAAALGGPVATIDHLHDGCRYRTPALPGNQVIAILYLQGGATTMAVAKSMSPVLPLRGLGDAAFISGAERHCACTPEGSVVWVLSGDTLVQLDIPGLPDSPATQAAGRRLAQAVLAASP